VSVPAATEDRLRSSGLRATRARIGVIETLEILGGHRTADDVARALAESEVAVSRATVFNVLDDLTRVGLVMVADAGSGATRYELATQWHHHFVCEVCGAIADVPCTDGSELCIAPVGIEGVVNEVQVIFRGTCGDCIL